MGIGGLLALMALSFLMGGAPLSLLNDVGQISTAPSDPLTGSPPAEDAAAQFVSVVLADTEDTWSPLFAQINRQYDKPRLVLFSDAVQSACGTTSAAVGPFYCPADAQVYIDQLLSRAGRLEVSREFEARRPATGFPGKAVHRPVGPHASVMTRCL
jgi:hypothetical protein